MELRLYIQMLQRGWWIVLLTALSALAIALVTTFLATPIYQASARFIVSPNASLSRGVDVVNSLEALDKRSIVTTYAEVLNSDNIYRQTLATYGLSPDQMNDYSYTTVVLPDTSVLELSVEGPNPAVVALLANSIGQQAISYVRGLNQVYEINVLDPAQEPTDPIRPQPLRDLSLAFALGIIVGAVLAIVRAQLIAPIEAFLQRSTMDEESGASNRRHFESTLEESVTRDVGYTVSVGLVQLEGLQGFIGIVPPPIAQDVLRQVTKTMRNELRGNDMVGRWNGTSFAVLLPETPGQAAVSTLGRIQVALSRPITFGEGETLHLRPSIGAAERQLGESSAVLMDYAQRALDQALHGDTKMVLYKTKAFYTA